MGKRRLGYRVPAGTEQLSRRHRAALQIDSGAEGHDGKRHGHTDWKTCLRGLKEKETVKQNELTMIQQMERKSRGGSNKIPVVLESKGIIFVCVNPSLELVSICGRKQHCFSTATLFLVLSKVMPETRWYFMKKMFGSLGKAVPESRKIDTLIAMCLNKCYSFPCFYNQKKNLVRKPYHFRD